MIPSELQLELAERLIDGEEQRAVIVWVAALRACELFGCNHAGCCNCRQRISSALLFLEGAPSYVDVFSADADLARELVAVVDGLDSGIAL